MTKKTTTTLDDGRTVTVENITEEIQALKADLDLAKHEIGRLSLLNASHSYQRAVYSIRLGLIESLAAGRMTFAEAAEEYDRQTQHLERPRFGVL